MLSTALPFYPMCVIPYATRPSWRRRPANFWGRQYEKFWCIPNDLPKAWIGLLFSILSLSLQTYDGSSFHAWNYLPNSQDLISRWRSIALSCSQAGDNSLKGAQYSLQAKIMATIGMLISPSSVARDCSTWTTIIARDAIHMGLHRDPSHFRSIRPFDSEIRRRLWALVTQFDVLSSFHMGVPSSIRSTDTDTEEPLNVADDQLTEAMTEPPEPVPFSSDIPIGYMILKSRLCNVLRRVVEFINSLNTDAYDQALRIHRDLEATYDRIPPLFQFPSWEEASRAPPTLFVQRIHLNLLFHQGICALHRKYLPLSLTGENDTYRASRDACQASALMLLLLQERFFQELKSGGVVKPAYGRSIMPESENFGLAAAVLCLCLHRMDQEQKQKQRALTTSEAERREEILRALLNSRDIYTKLAKKTETANTLSQVLTYVLSKVVPADDGRYLSLESGRILPSPTFPAPEPIPSNGASGETLNLTSTEENGFSGFNVNADLGSSGGLVPEWPQGFDWVGALHDWNLCLSVLC